MKQKGIMIVFLISFVILLSVSVFFVFPGRYLREWRNQTMLRMEVPYEKDHPTGKAAAYFATLVREETDGQIEVSVAYSTEPGSVKDVVKQLQFGGIAFTAVNFIDFCEEIPELNRFIGAYTSPEAAQKEYLLQLDEIQGYFSKERMEVLACYRPDYRCIASKEEPCTANDFTGLKIHAAKAATLSAYILNLGAEIENSDRIDLLRAVDSGYIDGSEMPLLMYNRAGFDKVMPYVWVYDDFLIPDILVASTVSLGNLPAQQQKILLECARKTEAFQLEALLEAQQKQWEKLRETE